MVFSSNVFLFLFLPIFLGLYYLSGQRYRNLLLLIASYIFYAWWRVDFLALFIGVTVWNYWIGLQVAQQAYGPNRHSAGCCSVWSWTSAFWATSSTRTSVWTASTRP